jgi:hypothetical protein
MGGENRASAHYWLFRKALTTSGIAEEQIGQAPRFAESRNLVDGIDRLFVVDDLPVALGAGYALEAQADSMIKGLHIGFRQFRLEGSNVEFFDVHRRDEPAHKEYVRKCLLADPALQGRGAEIARGARELLGLFAALWERIHKETRS